ncbi:uncharacterized protein LOC100377625 [Saccoglossus kowalevskii]|uniref:Uncharacterized protein LOC100377625 n=1 Tax=Saccoglossus kowalevskii TaxID=10224 RepID=A0ABM0GR41_SACKO|nr:PREDICTED: uncharacterized protein LOC100377625 [Saccoglossus kowalevskii]
MSSDSKGESQEARHSPTAMRNEGVTRKMATNTSQDVKRSSWLGLSRSKKKYNFRSEPTYSEPPDEAPKDKMLGDSRDIPTLLERLDRFEEVDNPNGREVISLQKTLISKLLTENKQLKSKKSYAEVLEKENLELKKEIKELKDNRNLVELLKKDNPKQNGVNVDESTSTVVDSLSKEIRNLKAENSRLKIINDQIKYAKEQLQIALDHQIRQMKENASQSNGAHNGLSQMNGHHNTSLSNKGNHSRASSYSSPAVSTCNDEIEVLDDDEDDRDSGYPASEGQFPSPGMYASGSRGRASSLQTVACIYKACGVFHHCDEILIERLRFNLRSRHIDLNLDDWTKTSTIGRLCLVFCLNASRVGSDVENALQGISKEAEVVLIVMHHVPYKPNRVDPQSEDIIGKRENICLVVDMLFFEKDGLYDCEQNDKALARIIRLFEMLC